MAENETYDPRDLLSKPLSDFPDLPDLPASKSWFGKLTGEVTADKSSKQQTPFLRFGIRITDPGKDVPTDFLASIAASGFSLADYDCGANFYITPNAMKMLRRFLTTLGFSESISSLEILKLDPQTGNPTLESKEVMWGRDVMFQTPAKDDQGRVYWRNVDNLAGVKGT